MTTKEVLRKARALVKEGWCQQDLLRQEYGKTLYCALGALDTATGGPSDNTPAYKRMLRVTRAVDGQLSEWNDAKGRTKAQVLAAFDRAIKACK